MFSHLSIISAEASYDNVELAGVVFWLERVHGLVDVDVPSCRAGAKLNPKACEALLLVIESPNRRNLFNLGCMTASNGLFTLGTKVNC